MSNAMAVHVEQLKSTVETLTGRTAHYDRELTTMQELEAQSIQILKDGYERQLGDMRANCDRLVKQLSVGREIREWLSVETARTLEAKTQLEKDLHGLKLQLQEQQVLQ